MKIIEKIDTFIHLKQELFKLEEELNYKKDELAKISQEIQEKNCSLESLKTEVIELKDFINFQFREQCGKYDYQVDIMNCYVIELNGIKYIAYRICKTHPTNVYTLATGRYYINHYFYYDVLNPKNGKFKMFYDYTASSTETGYSSFGIKTNGLNHSYEAHVLELFPELSVFSDHKVPNTYLKKLYYELNNLGSKGYIKEKKFEV